MPIKQKLAAVLPVVTSQNIKVNDSILKGQSRSSLGTYTNKSYNAGVTPSKIYLSAVQNNRSLNKNNSQSSFEFQPSVTQFRKNRNTLEVDDLAAVKNDTESSNFPALDGRSTVSGRLHRSTARAKKQNSTLYKLN